MFKYIFILLFISSSVQANTIDYKSCKSKLNNQRPSYYKKTEEYSNALLFVGGRKYHSNCYRINSTGRCLSFNDLRSDKSITYCNRPIEIQLDN